MRGSVAVVGAGWAGATAARVLHDAGVDVEVFEAAQVVGGHSRAETLCGVVYEPNGAHIFHTSNRRVADFVRRFGMGRGYRHSVLSSVFLHEDDEHPTLLSWPVQVGELRDLSIWPTVERELAALRAHPAGDDFETYVRSMMGDTLYRLFIRDYTAKQWGRPASELSSSFAPQRVQLRNDGTRRLFHDEWEFFEPQGVNKHIGFILRPVGVTCGARITVDDLSELGRRHRAVAVTAPLDDFWGETGLLAWRGVSLRSRFIPCGERERLTPAYVVNHPSARVPYTRTVETKHATGQHVVGTVVSEEYPGADARHYPVPTLSRRYERQNDELQRLIRAAAAPLPVYFCGRLATYQYIDQDEAIEQGMDCGEEILRFLKISS